MRKVIIAFIFFYTSTIIISYSSQKTDLFDCLELALNRATVIEEVIILIENTDKVLSIAEKESICVKVIQGSEAIRFSSRILHKLEKIGFFTDSKYLKGKTHLFYQEDIVLFCDADAPYSDLGTKKRLYNNQLMLKEKLVRLDEIVKFFRDEVKMSKSTKIP